MYVGGEKDYYRKIAVCGDKMWQAWECKNLIVSLRMDLRTEETIFLSSFVIRGRIDNVIIPKWKSVTEKKAALSDLSDFRFVSPFAISAPAEVKCRRVRMVVAKVNMLTQPLGKTINMHTLCSHLSTKL